MSQIAEKILEGMKIVVTKDHGWRPIETAPRDGTRVLGFWSYVYDSDPAPTIGMDVISWETCTFPDGDVEGWVDSEGLCFPGVFTHWQPLPEPPEVKP